MRGDNEALATSLRKIIGQPVWSVIGGLNTGSDFDMLIGSKRRRSEPLKNPTVTDDEREFDGEFAL
jgi:hypothetical protein